MALASREASDGSLVMTPRRPSHSPQWSWPLARPATPHPSVTGSPSSYTPQWSWPLARPATLRASRPTRRQDRSRNGAGLSRGQRRASAGGGRAADPRAAMELASREASDFFGLGGSAARDSAAMELASREASDQRKRRVGRSTCRSRNGAGLSRGQRPGRTGLEGPSPWSRGRNGAGLSRGQRHTRTGRALAPGLSRPQWSWPLARPATDATHVLLGSASRLAAMELASREASDCGSVTVHDRGVQAAMELASREASDDAFSYGLARNLDIEPQWSWPLARPATSQSSRPTGRLLRVPQWSWPLARPATRACGSTSTSPAPTSRNGAGLSRGQRPPTVDLRFRIT